MDGQNSIGYDDTPGGVSVYPMQVYGLKFRARELSNLVRNDAIHG